MNTLFINLTRFGDLLQTQPAISATARLGRKTGLLCLENFYQASVLLNDLHEVHPLRGAQNMALLDKDWRQALLLQRQSMRHVVREFAPDCIVGLTASLSARLLSRQLALATESCTNSPPQNLGFGLDVHGFDASSSPWVTFLQAASKKRGCSPFNVVDLFCKASGLDAGPWPNALRTPPDGAKAVADEVLGPLPEGHAGYVGLQLGASRDCRRWPVASFAELGKMCSRQLGLMPLLLGSKGERHLAERYLQEGAPGVDCAGKTDLQQLAAIVERCELLVSNDTGTMHLAAGLGRPVVGIFLATAQPWDTGPYLPGSLSLEPDMDCHPCDFGTQCPRDLACRESISTETVFSAVCRSLQLDGGESFSGARVWRSAEQEAGFMGLECLSAHEQDDRTQWIRLQRHIYRHFLDQQPVPPLAVPCVLSEASRSEALQTLGTAEQMLTLMQQQAVLLTQAPREALKRKFLATWQRVQGLFSQSSLFNVLSYLFAVQSQMSGREMQEVQHFVRRWQELVIRWQALLQK